MFNGIIFSFGEISKIIKRPKGINIFLKSKVRLKSKDIGVSVSCDGVCLTLVSVKNNLLEFYLSNETIKRSKFANLSLVGNIFRYRNRNSCWSCNFHYCFCFRSQSS